MAVTGAKEGETAQVVRRWLEEGWGERNFDLIDELFSPKFTASGGPTGKVDRLAYKKYCESVVIAIPDLFTEIVELYDGGNIVIVKIRTGGTHTGHLPGNPASGGPVETEMVDVWRVDDGLITQRETAEYDTQALREKLGFVPRFQG